MKRKARNTVLLSLLLCTFLLSNRMSQTVNVRWLLEVICRSNVLRFLDRSPAMYNEMERYLKMVAPIAAESGLSPESVELVLLRELLNSGKSIGGMGWQMSEYLKLNINQVRAKLFGPETGDKESGNFAGLSLGPYNQKAGMFTMDVIENINDVNLRNAFLQNFDYKRGHVDQQWFATVFTGNVDNDVIVATKLYCAYASEWVPAIDAYVNDISEVPGIAGITLEEYKYITKFYLLSITSWTRLIKPEDSPVNLYKILEDYRAYLPYLSERTGVYNSAESRMDWILKLASTPDEGELFCLNPDVST